MSRVFDAIGDRTAAEVRLCKRHLMQSVAVLRYMLALEQSGWVMTPGIRSVISANTLAVVQTQAIEDLNGVQRNAASARGSYRYRRPPRSMAQVLTSETLSKRHRFETTFWGTPTVRDGPQISKEMSTTTAPGSLPFEQIASTEAGAPWHSPQASGRFAAHPRCPCVWPAPKDQHGKSQRHARRQASHRC